MAKFPIVSISTLNGVRDWSPGHATTEKIPEYRAKLESAGHVDIQIVELPELMTRAQARDYLATSGNWNFGHTEGATNMSGQVINHPNPTQTMSAYDIMMQQAKGMRDRAEVLTKQAQQAHELIKEAEKIEKAAAPLAPKPEPTRKQTAKAPAKQATKKEPARKVTAKQKAAGGKQAAPKKPTHEAPQMMQSGPATRAETVPVKEGAQPTA